MKALKYTIYEISAHSILSAAIKTEDGYRFAFDATEPSKERFLEETRQDDCPIFYQAMRILGFNAPFAGVSDQLRDVFVYIDFSGIFDRSPVGKVLEAQEKAEYMFRPEGIQLHFGRGESRYLAFERSASMSRNSRISFVREDVYDVLRERVLLDMTIGNCQLSKLYAYNALLFTSGRRYNDSELLFPNRIAVIENPRSVVKDVPVVTVEDDGSDAPVRKYHRVEKVADIEVLEFDGEGLISLGLARRLDPSEAHLHHSFQIRLPYIKGVVHEVDFRGLFSELGVDQIVDVWGNRLSVDEVELILTKSMFKGYGWMTENGLSFGEYLARCRKYDHALYVSGMDKVSTQAVTELNYQFLNTLAMTGEEFRPGDLPLGWTDSPELDGRHWITKATETAYFNLIANSEKRREYFLSELTQGELPALDRRRLRAEIVKKNGLFLEEPIYVKELADKAQGILNKYGAGQLLITGDNRYLSDDLMRLFVYIIKAAGASGAAIERLERECLSGNEIYAPNPQYTPNEVYTLLRSPHIARNEEALARPLKNVGEIRERYLSHLHYILMVDSRSLMPERLGGADFDGDMVKTIADPLVNRCVRRGYANGEALSLLKIPTAKPLTANADDWRARYECVRSTFSSRVGQISNAALRLGMIAYNENSGAPERTALRHEIEILTILTGLEIDSAKSGIKPDLSEYLNGNGRGKNLFLQYKAIVMDGEAARKWYEPTKTERLKRYFEGVDWQRVSSNLEKLPYYARELERKTKEHAPMPVRDEELFNFAKRPEWREQLNPALLERMRSLIGDYEEAQRRLRYLRHAPGEMRRRSDVERILYARGQEELYSVDALYSLFDSIAPERIHRMRARLTEEKWHLTPPEQREDVLAGMVPGILSTRFAGVLCDFRCGGYRVLGDIICDFDDLHTNALIHRRMTVQKNDSADLRLMLTGITKSGDTREELIRRCLYALGAHEARERIDYEEAAKCAIALGKRQFALEVLTSSVLNLTREEQGKNNAGGGKKKKRRLFRK